MKKPKTIEKIIPLTNGIFAHMNYNFRAEVSKTTLDFMFGTNYAKKNPSPTVERIMGDDEDPMSEAKLTFMAQMILEIYKPKWDKMAEIYDIEYDPIHNYLDEWEDTSQEDRELTGSTTGTKTVEYGKVDTLHSVREDDLEEDSTLTHGTNVTRTDNLTELETRALNSTAQRTDNLMETNTYGKTSTRSDNLHEVRDTDTTSNDSGSDADNIYGFNSSVAVGANTGSSSNTGSNNVDETIDNTGTQATVEGGSDSKANTGTQSTSGSDTGTVTTANTGTVQNATTGTENTLTENTGTRTTDQTNRQSGVDTTRDTGSTTDVESTGKDRSGRHFGNIGNLTSQKQIQEEINLWRWNYVKEILNDVSEFCCLPVYLTPYC